MTVRTLWAGALALAAIGAAIPANAATIADWTFETSQPITAGPIAPETGAGAASGSHAGATAYSTPSGNGSSHSYSSTVWAVGDYWQFSADTTGDSALYLQFDQVSSNTGPGSFQLQTSTDGTTFSNFGSAYTVLANATPNSWSSSTPITTTTYSLDLSTALNAAGTTYVRLVDAGTTSANGGTVASTGTDRVDNVILSTTPIATPEPASLGLLALGGAALLTRRRK